MSVELIEVATSRPFAQDAATASGTWDYVGRVLGEANPEEALFDAVLADAPFFWYAMSRRDIKGENQGGGIWTAEVPYQFEVAGGAAQDPTQTPGPSSGPGGGAPSGTPAGPASENEAIRVNVNMEIGGRPPHIVRSLKTYDSAALNGVVPADFKKAINVQADGRVEGCEVPEPESTFTLDMTLDYVSWKYIKLLQSMVYKTNHATWFTYPIHAVAFLGASLKTNEQGRVGVSLKFGTSRQNVLTAGDPESELRPGLPAVVDSPFVVPGWHFLRVVYETVVDAAAGKVKMVERPYAIYAEQILQTANFALLGIGT